MDCEFERNLARVARLVVVTAFRPLATMSVALAAEKRMEEGGRSLNIIKNIIKNIMKKQKQSCNSMLWHA